MDGSDRRSVVARHYAVLVGIGDAVRYVRG